MGVSRTSVADDSYGMWHNVPTHTDFMAICQQISVSGILQLSYEDRKELYAINAGLPVRGI